MIEDEYGTSITDENTLDYLLHMEFTLIEENQDIDIQNIEDLSIWTTYRCKDNTGTKLTEDNLVQTMEKIKELIQAIKQLDRQINNN